MPYNSSGIFNRVHTWELDRINNVEISSDRHDEEDDNFAEGLSQCVLRDGRAPMSGDLNMNNLKIYNVANATAANDAVNKAQLDVKANDNAVVHLAGTETITGTKTFSGTGWITVLKDTSVTYNVAPASDTNTEIVFNDKNNSQMGVVGCKRTTDNATLMYLSVHGANNYWASQPLQLRVEADGTAAAYAPASAATNSVVTTKAISKSANGYVKLGNGIIIQWMLTSNITRSGTVITFPTPFTTENYAVCFNPYRSEPLNENATTVTERTASNCKVYGRTYDGGDMNCPCFVLAIGY